MARANQPKVVADRMEAEEDVRTAVEHSDLPF
jgi:hypothetical protein